MLLLLQLCVLGPARFSRVPQIVRWTHLSYALLFSSLMHSLSRQVLSSIVCTKARAYSTPVENSWLNVTALSGASVL